MSIPAKTIRTMRRFRHFDLVELEWDDSDYGGTGALRMEVYLNKNGDYVSGRHRGKRCGIVKAIAKRGIAPELRDDQKRVCSIGKGDDGKWYGWSHRAMCGFGPGDRLYEEGWKPEDGRDSAGVRFVEHGDVVIETDAQARQAACNFAASVS